MKWRPIAELSPEIGKSYLVGWRNGSYDFLMWKENRRIKDANGEFSRFYFGDPVESDDYDFAKLENFPELYLPIPEIEDITSSNSIFDTVQLSENAFEN